MSTQFQIDNNGIGGTPFLTFTMSNEPGQYFTQADLDKNITACVITDNNEVGKGEVGERLFGRVVWVSQELIKRTDIPCLCAVQARGVARFKHTEERPPIISFGTCVNGAGLVTSRVGPGGGYVIAVNEEDQTCDIWLG